MLAAAERHVEAALGRGEVASLLPAQMLADIFLLNVFAGLMAWAAKGEPGLDVVLPAVVDIFFHGAVRAV